MATLTLDKPATAVTASRLARHLDVNGSDCKPRMTPSRITCTTHSLYCIR